MRVCVSVFVCLCVVSVFVCFCLHLLTHHHNPAVNFFRFSFADFMPIQSNTENEHGVAVYWFFFYYNYSFTTKRVGVVVNLHRNLDK